MSDKTNSFVRQNKGVLSDKMGRPTEDLKGKRITVRVNEETYERLSESENVSEEARRAIERGLGTETLLEEMWEMTARKLEITQMELYEAVNCAVEKEVLYNRDGKLFFKRGETLTPDYVSVDLAIDCMDVPEWKKKNYKEKILKDISKGINDYSDEWA